MNEEIRELTLDELDDVQGGIIPAIYGAYYAGQFLVSYYGGAQIAGFAVGATVTGISTFIATA